MKVDLLLFQRHIRCVFPAQPHPVGEAQQCRCPLHYSHRPASPLVRYLRASYICRCLLWIQKAGKSWALFHKTLKTSLHRLTGLYKDVFMFYETEP